MESKKSSRTLRELYNNHRGGIVMWQQVDEVIEHFYVGFNNEEEAKAAILSECDDRPVMRLFLEIFLNRGTWEHVNTLFQRL